MSTLLLAGLLAPTVGAPPVAAAPTAAPQNLQPTAGTFTDNPTLSWERIDEGDGPLGRYRVQVDDNADFSSPIHSVDTYNSTYAPTNKLPAGTIHWRVAGNEAGLGPWATGSFEVELAGPTATSPANGAALEFPVEPSAFTWTPKLGASDYTFQWANNPEFINGGEIRSATNGAILVGTVPFGEEYYWRVRANFPGNVATDWSTPQTFSVVWPNVEGKGKPTLTSPPTTVPISEVTDIALRWDPVVGAERYELQASLNQDFSGFLLFSSLVYGTQYSPPETWPNGAYYWRVRARDRNGNLGPWSSTGTFARRWPIDPLDPAGREGIPGLLNPPTQISPSEGQLVDSSLMVYEWEPVDRASRYQVELLGATDNLVASCFTIHTRIVEGTAWSCGGLFPNDPVPTTYKWRVRAIDDPAVVFGLWSVDNPTFTHVNSPCDQAGGHCPADFDPSAPGSMAQDPLPVNCTELEGCAFEYSQPDMSWAPVDDASHYVVWVALDPQFTNIFGTYGIPQNYDDAGQPVRPVLLSSTEWPDNDAGQAYFWHVQACGPLPNPPGGTGCTPSPEGQIDPPRFAFQKRSKPVVTLAPGQEHDPQAPSGTPPRVTETPTFTWEHYLESNLADGTSNLEATNYEIQVSTTDVFNSLLDAKIVDQPFYHPFDRTYPEGPIYWRVRAIDASNQRRTWSEIRVFDYESVPPALNAPADGALLGGTPQFSWETIPFARDYQFELYKNGLDPISPGNRIDNRATMFGDFTPYLDLPSGWYAWRVRRDDGQGRDGPWSEVRTFQIAYPGPQLTQPASDATIDTDDVTFTWVPVDQATRYRFERSSTEDFTSINESSTTVMTAWAPLNRIDNGEWWWRVHALNKDGVIMGTSAPARHFTKVTLFPPGAPTAVTAVAGDGEATVSWTPPAEDGGTPITGYTVTAEPGGATCSELIPTTCVVDGLTNGTSYTFTVVATNARGDSPPSASSNAVTPATAPGAPTNVTGTPGNGQVAVSWTAPADDGGVPVQSYTVTATPGGATCTSGTTNCTVSGLTNGSAYTFRVTATGPGGTSAPSAPSAAITPRAVPTPPTNLTGTAGDGQIAASWTASADDGGSPITGYTVTATPGGATCSTGGATSCTVTGLTNGISYSLRATATNAAGTSLPSAATPGIRPGRAPDAPTAVTASPGNAEAAVTWTAPANDGGSPVTGYTATATPGGASCATPNTGCTISGLTNGTSYTVTVTATNALGTSTPSTPSSAVVPVAAPSAPTAVTGVPGDRSIVASWTLGSANGSPITGSTATAEPGGQSCTTVGTAASCIIGGLINGQAYTVRVRSTNAVGTSPQSAPSATIVPAAVPSAPRDVAAIPGNAKATVSWAPPLFDGGAAITGYTVTADPGGATCTSTTATTCMVTGLTNLTTYRFTVTATNAAGTSLPSAASPSVTPVEMDDCRPPAVGPFPDVPATNPFCSDIQWMALKGITTGYPDGTFKPGNQVDRQSMAAFLYRFAGSPAFTPPAFPTFSDVPTTSPFYSAIEWLASTGVTGGCGGTRFCPANKVTRDQMASFLYRFADSPTFEPPATPTFTDVPVSSLFFTAVEWLVSTGITAGCGGTGYCPGASVTRQSMAAFLHRYDGTGLPTSPGSDGT